MAHDAGIFGVLITAGSEEEAREAIKANPNLHPHSRDDTGKTVLFHCAGRGFAQLCRYFIEEHGVEVNAADNTLSSALHTACRSGNLEIAMILQAAGARIDSKDIHGNTPIELAECEVIQRFLKFQSDLDTSFNTRGKSILHVTNRNTIRRPIPLNSPNKSPVESGRTSLSSLSETSVVDSPAVRCTRSLLEIGEVADWLLTFVGRAELHNCLLTCKDWHNRIKNTPFLMAYMENRLADMYEKLGYLDKGATGVVYKYRRRHDAQIVAAKQVMFQDGIEFAEMQEELALTRYACSPMHPERALGANNIVKYMDSHRMGNELWIMMEFMSGGKLTDVIKINQRSKMLPMDESCMAYVCREVLKALHFLHKSKNVMHRDVKSDNVLLHEDGTVKLADFGLSKACNPSDKRKTSTGTPFWMAPEVIQCDGGNKYTFEADVWSVGILLIEMCRGDPPYITQTVVNALRSIISNAPPRLRPGEGSEELRRFIEVTLEKNLDRKKKKHRWSVTELLSHPFIKKACEKEKFVTVVRDAKARGAALKSAAGLYTQPASPQGPKR